MDVADEIKQLDTLDSGISNAGKMLAAKCNGNYFPCDVLSFTVLSRSIGLINGFRLLIEGGCYESAASLFRMQLDNVLRLFGVITCLDPHGTANQVLSGTPLRKLAHVDGRKMTDAYLVEILGKKNPWLSDIYNLASGFVHLSEQHFQNFMRQSIQLENGEYKFSITDEDSHIPDDEKAGLIRYFLSMSRSVNELVDQWAAVRFKFGSTEELKARFDV